MMRFFLTCLGADLRASLAQPGDILAQLGFFVMITALFVLAAGPEGDRLVLIGLAGLWMAALASMVPAFDRLYEAEARSGWLDQLLVSHCQRGGRMIVTRHAPPADFAPHRVLALRGAG